MGPNSVCHASLIVALVVLVGDMCSGAPQGFAQQRNRGGRQLQLGNAGNNNNNNNNAGGVGANQQQKPMNVSGILH